MQVKERHDSLDKKKLFQEQSALINKISRTLSSKVYSNFVPNYKTIASVYSIFQDALPVRDRVLLEENIIDQMSASIDTTNEILQPIDSLVYTTFVNNFNKEYSNVLNENQKALLNNYVSSFADNGVELKVYLNEEIGRIKKTLEGVKSKEVIISDKNLKQKVEKVYSILDETKLREVDIKTIEIVLTAQELIEELSEDGD